MNFASAKRRFAAFTLDWIIVVTLFALIGWIIGATKLAGMPMIGFIFYLALPFTGWLYFALFESSKWQATPGKKLLSLRVVCLDGTTLSFGRATGRYCGKWLSRLLLMIGFLMVIWTEKKQALHDKIARCVVITKF